MKFLKHTIILILLFTTACVDKKLSRIANDDFIALPTRVEKRSIQEKFSDLPFDSAKEIKVALLLPLSGKYDYLGNSLYKAAQLSLFDHGDPRVVVYPFDTAGNEFSTIAAMEQVVEKDINIVIGPVFSKNLTAIKPIAKKHNITIISFSNNIEIAEPNIYTLGIDAKAQMKRLISYAMENEIKYFATLAPGNSYGSKVVSTLRENLPEDGLVVKSEFFTKNQPTAQIVKRVLTHLAESPVDEAGNPLYIDIPEDLEIPLDDETGLPIFKRMTEYKTGLLIADGSSRLAKIAAILEKQGISENTRLLGLSQWDGKMALQNKIFKGAWYTDIPKENLTLFEDHFYDVYGKEPRDLDMLAYDAISVISALASYHTGTEPFDLRMLNDSVGFSGISGVFRFGNNGVVERLYEIYEVGEGGSITTFSPAKFQFDE